jgi:hypothetical protein
LCGNKVDVKVSQDHIPYAAPFDPIM